ncbi:MAG TPA: SRPBCC family protein [Burkholderiaceae bacterium]|nr:SRPBCC family protein [Burkholderiaceae bacterium]
MADYSFITHWHIEAPLHPVYDVIFRSLEWPTWWHGAERVDECAAGDADGIGSIRRYTWKGRLPYRLTFDACTTRIEPMAILEATTSGDLEGMGRWVFSEWGEITTVRYEWQVRTTKPWMNAIAPLAAFAFRKNHDALMQQGAEGLALHLNARLVAVSHAEAPSGLRAVIQCANR